MRVAFADFSGLDFHAQSVDFIPLGGSQSAGCHLARALVRAGHAIFLISNCSSPGHYDGVTCLALSASDTVTLRSLNLDVLVCILGAGNGAKLREMLGSDVLLILWNQHAHDELGVQALKDSRERSAYDGFAMVSDWQLEQYHRCFGIDRRRMVVMRNAIAPAFAGLFSDHEHILSQKTAPPVLAYTSTPFRGLDLLLEAFGQIRKAVSGTRLRVYSSMKVYQTSAVEEEVAFGALYQRCRQMEGVEYLGSLPQRELARELRRVAILAYPNTFPETSCISVMEALAAGCRVVTSQLGALPETGSGFADLVSVERGWDVYLDEFVKRTVVTLRESAEDGAMEAKLRRQVAEVNRTTTWPVRARQWTDWLSKLADERKSRETARATGFATMTIPQALERALQHHQSGRLAEAETLYRQILAAEPRHADALHLLGVLAQQVGRHEIAVDLIRQAITLAPDVPDFHSNLGIALKEMGQLDEAIAACRRAIALKPNYPQAYSNLGRSLYDKGQVDEAIAAQRQAIALQPHFPEAYCHLGNALHGKGRLDEAIAAYRQAIALRPDFLNACNNLGVALHDKGQWNEAIAAYREVIALHPNYAQAHSNLGLSLYARRQLDDAIAAYRQAIALQPSLAEAHNHLGSALRDRGRLAEALAAFRQAIALQPNYPEAHNHLGAALNEGESWDEAIAALRQALARKPDFPEAHNNLGNALKDQGHLDEAICAYRQALALRPNFPEAHNNLGNALKDQGRLDEAIAAFRQAIAFAPHFANAHSNLLLTVNYHPGFDARAIAGEQRLWNRRHAEPLRSCFQAHQNERNPDRRLRIGYVSADFREHASAYFLVPLLEHHDPLKVELICYAEVLRPDAITGRLQRCAQWRSTVGLSDEQVAKQIRDDRIDILVDLKLHTARHRLPVFARKPAPVQVTWLGHPGSTGLGAIDYRFSDPSLDPPGTDESLYAEETVRLPHTFWCYDPLDGREVPTNPSPAQSNGFITFGCLNNFCKINDRVLDLWVKVLLAVPSSRLLLLAPEGDHRRHLLERLGQEAINAARLELVVPQPRRKYLELYHRIDLGLDTLPYNGHTTSLDSLWMGVPVVTLVGQTLVGRAGLSQLMNLDLPELIASTPEDYVRIAAALANDLPRLSHLRRTLRPRMEASPLMDAPRFARDIEAAFREMWRQWCAREG